MLGLMQMLYFVMDSRTLPLAREIFQLSQHETQARPSAAFPCSLRSYIPFISNARGKGSAKTSSE